jgi:hypothetical protein
MPIFRPLVCANCSSVIRGTQFRCIGGYHQPDQNQPPDKLLVYCEECARAGKHCKAHLRKFEKRCILREVVSPMRSRWICTCENSQHPGNHDGDNDVEQASGDLYFAVSGERQRAEGCMVLKLRQQHERARFAELRHNTEFKRQVEAQTGVSRFSQTRPAGGRKVGRSKTGSTHVRNYAVGRAARSIPPPIEFGNIYMMLMVGTLIIENGFPE